MSALCKEAAFICRNHQWLQPLLGPAAGYGTFRLLIGSVEPKKTVVFAGPFTLGPGSKVRIKVDPFRSPLFVEFFRDWQSNLVKDLENQYETSTKERRF